MADRLKLAARSPVMASVLVAVVLVLAARIGNAGDPELVWKTIETEHFVIHYDQSSAAFARHAAASAEQSHAAMSPLFDYAPGVKTHIVVTDYSDSANGFARVLPVNRIELLAAAPTSLQSLNDHDDWLYLLVAHEYAHILHLDTVGGLPKLVNRVLGKTWPPNQVQPRWITEGIATYQESQQTSSGRLRSSLFDMELRVPTLADQLHDLDAMTNGPANWPYGTTAYLYGSHFLRFVFDRYGADTMRQISWSYGSNPIPYSLNRTIREATGHTFEDLYADWVEYLRDKYAMQLEAIERTGRREGRRLTLSRETNRSPRYTRDGGHIVWFQSDGYSPSRLRIMPVGENVGKARDYATIERLGTYSLLSDGSMIVEQVTSYRTIYQFRNLFRWDRKTASLHPLTHGLRIRDPAVSPDERQVAFVLLGQSRGRIAVMPLRPHAPHRVLWQGPHNLDQASAPRWSPDGKYIAFSAWQQGGYRDIVMVDVESGQAEHITHDRALDLGPVFSPDGAYLYYSSDRSGIYNIYALDLKSRKTYQVTNVLGGAVRPDVSPDGKLMVYQGFVLGGYDLYEIELDPERWIEPVPYVNDRPDPVEVRVDDLKAAKPRPYRALETLAPKSYTIELVSNSFGNALSIATGRADMLELHNYSLGVTLSLERRDVNFFASYGYAGLWPYLSVSVSRDIARRFGFTIDGINTAYIQDTYRLSTRMSLPVLRTDRGSGDLTIGYDVDWLNNVGDAYEDPDPSAIIPRFPETDVVFGGLSLSWNYGDLRGYNHAVGLQEGKALSLFMRINDPLLGSDFRSLVLSYRWDAFLRLPWWGENGALAFRLAGGIRTSNQRSSGLFVFGGAPNQDIVQSVINSTRVSSSGYLRGYPRSSIFGRQYHLANIEYRQKLFEVERGLVTLPVFVRELHVAGLLDVGNAFNGDIDLRDFKASLGASLRLDVVLGYFVGGMLDIGYMRGLTDSGVGEYWLLLAGNI